MGRWLGWFLKMVRAASGASLALTMALRAVVMMGGPSPSSTLTRDVLVWRVDSASSGGYGG
jgi:hypothetical protein